jgi:alkylated DNA nucleotide flippase Atl1
LEKLSLGDFIPVEVSERTYQYVQRHAVAFEDSFDSALARLLGLDDDASSTASPPASPASAIRGTLAPLLDEGVLREGDDLRWHRAQKGVTYSAKVGPNGTVQLESGQLIESPSGAAVALAGGNHPGWDVWTHIPSGLTLAELRSRATSPAPSPIRSGNRWQSTLEEVLERLPHGTWTSYGDLGRLLDRNPRELGNYLATTAVPNAHRVLQHNGRISPNFRWIDEDRGDIQELLRREGVLPPTAKVAAPEQRLHVEDLRELLADLNAA